MTHVSQILLLQAQLQQSVDRESCRLLHSDKELDLHTPFRFLNLPSNATLVLVTGKEAKLGVQSDEKFEQKGLAKQKMDRTRPFDQVAGNINAPPGDIPKESNVRLEEKTRMYIFSRHQEIEMIKDNESPDQINYEVNQSDVLLLQSSLSKRNEDVPLKTRKMREEELQRKIDNLGPVQLRIEFPGIDMIVQFELSAKSSVGTLYDVVKHQILSEKLENEEVILFTTPPKCILNRKSSTSLYGVGLHPAARIKIELPQRLQKAEEIFCPSILKDIGTLPPRIKSDKLVEVDTDSAFSAKVPVSSKGASSAGIRTGDGVPKWFSRK